MKDFLKNLAVAVPGVLFTVSTSSLPAQNLLVNGSFEMPMLTPGSFGRSIPLMVGDTNLPGWSIDGPGSLYLMLPSTNSLPALNGRQYIDFNGRGGGAAVSQTFVTVPGEAYEGSFVVGCFTLTNPAPGQVTAEVFSDTGVRLGSAAAMAPNRYGWASPTRFQFTATSPESTLRFLDTNGSVNIDLVLDDASVQRTTPRLSIECSHVRICWEAQTNRLYQLQARSSMETDWQNVGTPVPGGGTNNCIIEALTETHMFFRVLTLP